MHPIYTILRDTRERNKLLFPDWISGLAAPPSNFPTSMKLVVKDVRLDAGDYALESHPTHCIVERKGSIREVADNCLTSDRPRFERALVKLKSACTHPWLILEGSPYDLLRPRKGALHEPGVALHALIRVLALYNIPWLMLPSHTQDHRRSLGEVVARILIEHSHATIPGPHPGSPLCPVHSSSALQGPSSPSPSSSR